MPAVPSFHFVSYSIDKTFVALSTSAKLATTRVEPSMCVLMFNQPPALIGRMT